MFIKSISAFFNEVLTFNSENKYEIVKIKKSEKDEFIITCYVKSQRINIDLKLIDIINNNKLKYFKTRDIIELTRIFYTNNAYNSFFQENFKYLLILSYFFILIYLISNIAAVKLVNFKNITFSGGMITFPMLYVLNDIITETYGLKFIRKTILYALMANFILTFLLYVIALLPAYNNTTNQAFNSIFTLTPRIFIASIISYLVGEFLNSYLLAMLKNYFNGKYFAARAIISTLFGSLIDTSIFFLIVFTSIITDDVNITINILILSIVKVIYELIMLPVAVYIVNYLKIHENIN